MTRYNENVFNVMSFCIFEGINFNLHNTTTILVTLVKIFLRNHVVFFGLVCQSCSSSSMCNAVEPTNGGPD